MRPWIGSKLVMIKVPIVVEPKRGMTFGTLIKVDAKDL
jgi:hypothetical protein